MEGSTPRKAQKMSLTEFLIYLPALITLFFCGLATVTSTGVSVAFFTGLSIGPFALIAGLIIGLGKFEKVIADERKIIIETKSSDIEERKQEEAEAPELDASMFDIKGYIRVTVDKIDKNSAKDHLKAKEWTFGTLKANMLMWKDNSKTTNPYSTVLSRGVMSLDGCDIVVIRNTPGATWKKTNHIRITHPDSTRVLVPPNVKTINVMVRTGKDLEDWYYQMLRASRLTSKNVKPLVENMKFFSEFCKKVKPMQMPVSADWFNALVARMFFNTYHERSFRKGLVGLIQKKIDKVKKPSLVSKIEVQEITLAPQTPVISNIQLISVSPAGEVQVDCDMDYQSTDGGFYIRIGVVLDIRVPGLGTSVTIPIVLAAHLNSIRGKMHVHISPPPANKLWIGFYSPPVLDMKVETEIGSKYKLVNIPKIADIIVNKLQSEMIKMMVLPEMDDWPVPSVKDAVDFRTWEWGEGVNVPDNKQKTVQSAPSTPKQEVKSEGSSPATSRKNSIDEAKDVSSTPLPLHPVRARRISTIVNDKEKDPKEVLQTIDAALQQAENSEELVDM
jgi:hypothetical protein